MTKKADRLVSDISVLADASKTLREVLVRYERAIATLASRVKRGESVLEAFDAMDGAMARHRELTEVLEEFETARHEVRLALFSLASAQGASMSELGRRLGISRQLASRLATKAESAKG
jgi:hypothetical protein